MSNITNHYAEGSCIFEAGSSQNGDITITGPIYQGTASPVPPASPGASTSAPAFPPSQGAAGLTPSSLHLSTTRGTKIDFIRVINTLYELGFFTDDKGGRISKKDVMTTLGLAVGLDLSNYDNDLARSLSDSTRLDKHLAIFHRMLTKMEDIFNAYGG